MATVEGPFTGLLNWNGLAECIDRTGAVRGDPLLEPLVMGDGWFDT